jgi:hypothetical protein
MVTGDCAATIVALSATSASKQSASNLRFIKESS